MPHGLDHFPYLQFGRNNLMSSISVGSDFMFFLERRRMATDQRSNSQGQTDVSLLHRWIFRTRSSSTACNNLSTVVSDKIADLAIANKQA